METQDTPAADATVESSPTPVVETTPADAGIPDKKDGVQKRIDTLTWEKHEKAREVEYWKQRALQADKPKEPEKPILAPKLSDFEFDEAKYQAALIEYTKAEARREAIEAIKAERQRDEEQNRFKSFKQRETEFIAQNPDYYSKVYNESNTFFTTDIARMIAESDDGPAVAYHLASNPELAWQLANMSPTAAAREMGRIEAKLEKQKEAPKPQVSAAPPPPPKIEAVEPEVVKDRDKMSDTEWFKLREKEKRKRK